MAVDSSVNPSRLVRRKADQHDRWSDVSDAMSQPTWWNAHGTCTGVGRSVALPCTCPVWPDARDERGVTFPTCWTLRTCETQWRGVMN